MSVWLICCSKLLSSKVKPGSLVYNNYDVIPIWYVIMDNMSTELICYNRPICCDQQLFFFVRSKPFALVCAYGFTHIWRWVLCHNHNHPIMTVMSQSQTCYNDADSFSSKVKIPIPVCIMTHVYYNNYYVKMISMLW